MILVEHLIRGPTFWLLWRSNEVDLEATDLELVRAAGGGDEGAFHALMDRHMKSLYRIAMGLTGNHADAEDVLQETFVGAFKGLRRFDGRSSVRTWLIAILTRQAAKG